MKYLFFYSFFFVFLIWSHLLQHEVEQYKVDFMKENNPVLRISKLIGKKVTVYGFLRKTYLSEAVRIFVIGKLGNPVYKQKFTTDFTIMIKNEDIKKFGSINNNLEDSYAIITGKIISYHGKLVLQLKDMKDFTVINPEKPPILR